MNVKKIIKGIMGLGAVAGIAYLSYKVGESNGEINERFRDKYGDEGDDDIEFAEDEDDFRFYDEPDDGCIAPSYCADDEEQTENNSSDFLPIEIIHIDGVTLGQLRGLLLHLTMMKTFYKKNVKEYLGIDDDVIINEVIDSFMVNGYITKRDYDKYKYHTVTSIADCSRLISW